MKKVNVTQQQQTCFILEAVIIELEHENNHKKISTTNRNSIHSKAELEECAHIMVMFKCYTDATCKHLIKPHYYNYFTHS